MTEACRSKLKCPDSDVLADLSVLLSQRSQCTAVDREIHQQRRSVMKENVYLSGMCTATLRDVEDQVQQASERRCTADAPDLAQDQAELYQRAQVFAPVASIRGQHPSCQTVLVCGRWSEPVVGPRGDASFAEVYRITRRND
ncbi:hypothetical protein [Cryobacterium sp. M15]|uniref:hypothetical protein n=1 Tax=Cryobacterium sp. M15 TaxID=2048291 RepID=UPI0011AFEF20|nr:hypothetical protein [Cryobacterium sp. M15]